MLIIRYTKLSAKVGIVFTCFFISFMNAQANTSLSSNNQDALEALVHEYLVTELNPYSDSNIRIKVRNIDHRIDIPDCPVPLTFSRNQLEKQQSNLSIKVACDNTGWYLFTHATMATIQQVVIVTDNLSPGALLNNSNVSLVDMDKNKLRGSAFFNADEVLGARMKRRVRAGSVIDNRMLCFICKGDRVTIAAVSGGLSIKVYGVAEEDGVLGDTIQVRNISSDKLIYARVASTTEVQISI